MPQNCLILLKIFWGASPLLAPPGLRPWTLLGAAPQTAAKASHNLTRKQHNLERLASLAPPGLKT